MEKIAILTNLYRYENRREADLILLDKLNTKGFDAQIINWDNEEFDFSEMDLAIVRSCWDYDQRVEEFLGKMEEISKVTKLINPFSTIKENSDKLYLLNLKAAGIDIVETHFLTETDNIENVLSNIKTDSVVIKPSISASGKNTYLINKSDVDEIRNKSNEILKAGTLMVQPFIKSIQTKGEKSTIVIDGEIIFTMSKKPKEGGFLIHTHKGGTYTPSKVDKKDLPFINKVINNLPKKTAYVRIDYLFDEGGKPMLLELEMIEPNLYLDQNDLGLKKLTNFILKELKQ